MSRILLLISLLFISFAIKAQKITIFNKTNNQKIERVAIYNSSKSLSVLTDEEGIADISKFKVNDTLFIQHSSFNPALFIKKELKQMNYQLGLTERTIELGQIIISANRWEQDRKEIPNKILSISSRTIAFENPQTTADLLGTTNEVFIQKSQLGGGSPLIRGFSANSVLLVFDGVRMNNAIYRSGNLQNVITIDPHIIENAEIIFGPGSVIYGSDALGGVMDFHTTRIKLSGNNKPNIKLNTNFRYATANSEKTAHIDLNFGKKKWGSLSSITISDFGDLKMGSDGKNAYLRPEYVQRINGVDSIIINDDDQVQKYSGYRQLNIFQKFRYKPGSKTDMNYSFYYTTASDIPRYDRLIQYSGNELKYASWDYAPQLWMINILNVQKKDSTKLYDESKLVISHQLVKEGRKERKYKSNELIHRTEEVQILTLNLDFDKAISKKNSVFYGLEGLYNDISSEGITQNIITGTEEKAAARYPDGINHYSTIAAYTDFKSNFLEKFTLNMGIRYSYVMLRSMIKDNTFYNFPFDEINLNIGSWNGSIGLVFHPEKNLQINTAFSSGFRAPNLDDIGKVFDSEPGNVVVPNENLKPENAYNLDLGFIKSFNDRLIAELSLFYTILNDVMVRKDFLFNGLNYILYNGDTSKVEAIVNAGKGYIYGGSIMLSANITSHFSARTNFNYMKGKDAENDEPLRHVPPVFGNTSLLFKLDKFRASLYANYNGRIAFNDLAPSEQNKAYLYTEEGSPSWITLNLKTSFVLYPNLSLDFGIENILDKRYRPYSSGISAAGRNFIIALKGNFK
ncbi:TonB-dependent receptor plug domain-containing protein [Bacteroidota bacterium]